jgi:hypothetical protein
MQPVTADDETEPLADTIGKRHVHALVILLQTLQHMVPPDFDSALSRELMKSLKEYGSPQADPGISVRSALLLRVMVNLQVAKIGPVLGDRGVEAPLFLHVTPQVIEQSGYLGQHVEPVPLDAIMIQRMLAYSGGET